MYTVFQDEGCHIPRTKLWGIVVFERTLREALWNAKEGDRVIRWTNSGGVAATYRVACAKSGRLIAKREGSDG